MRPRLSHASITATTALASCTRSFTSCSQDIYPLPHASSELDGKKDVSPSINAQLLDNDDSDIVGRIDSTYWLALDKLIDFWSTGHPAVNSRNTYDG